MLYRHPVRRESRPARPTRPGAERLEGRVLLAFGPSGLEINLNTNTPHFQGDVSVACDFKGDFVAAWTSDGQDGGGAGPGVFARLFTAGGTSRGPEFLVNTTTAGDQYAPSVAMDADGDFVVVWRDATPVFGPVGVINGQRYAADGTPRGGEFRVDQSAATDADEPAVAMDADGNFTVAYTERDDTGSVNVFVRQFAADGSPLGAETLVQPGRLPSIAMNAAGYGVIASQRLIHLVDPDGTPKDTLGLVVTSSDRAGAYVTSDYFDVSSQIWLYPTIAISRDRDILLCWQQQPPGPQTYAGVYAKRYGRFASDGTYPVWSGPNDPQVTPAVVADVHGQFNLVYQRWNNGNPDLYMQRSTSDGVMFAPELHVSQSPNGQRVLPAVAADANGGVVVAWEAGDGSSNGVYAQPFAENPDTIGPVVIRALLAGRNLVPGSSLPSSPPVSRLLFTWSEAPSTAGAITGAHSVINPANWKLTRDGADVSSSIQSVTLVLNNATGQYESALTLTPLRAGGNYVLTARSSIQDTAGNPLSKRAATPAGADYALPFVVVNQAPVASGIPDFSATEDSGDQAVSLFGRFTDATDPFTDLAFSVVGNTKPSLLRSSPINPSFGFGSLVLQFAPDATGSSVITIRATDSGGAFTDSSFNVDVSRVNDAPVNHVPGPQGQAPGQPLVFSAVNGNAISISDVDYPATIPGAWRVTLQTDRPDYTFQTTPNQNVIVLPVTNGIELGGPIPDVNAALEGMQLIPPGPAAGSTVLTVTTNDGGLEGSGGPFVDPPLQDVDAIPVTFGTVFTVADVSVGEGKRGSATPVTFTVRLLGGTSRGASVSYATIDGTATAADGDYQLAEGLLEFTPRDEPEKRVTVLVNGDGGFEPDEQFFLRLGPATGATIVDDSATATITNDDPPPAPPQLTGVYVSGSAWKPAFKERLAALGLGDAALGYSVPAGAAQLTSLPWANIDRISFRFSTDVFVPSTSLLVRGMNVFNYPLANFAYDNVAHTATWTLTRPVTADQLTLKLGTTGGVGTDVATRLMVDGEWANGADAFPSGDGTPGGPFNFRLNVLPGDSTRDGWVDAPDWLDVRARQKSSTAAPGSGANAYSVFADLDGSGLVGSGDLVHVRRNLLRTLPRAEPTGVLTSAPRARRADYRPVSSTVL